MSTFMGLWVTLYRLPENGRPASVIQSDTRPTGDWQHYFVEIDLQSSAKVSDRPLIYRSGYSNLNIVRYSLACAVPLL